MHDSNGKSNRILTKLRTDVPLISVKESPNFGRKYYLIADLFMLEYRWQNICF